MKASNPRSQSAALFSLIFLVASCCTAQTVTDVIGFTGQNSLGNPTMAPTQGRNAELYGTSFDPQSTSGSIFSSTTTGAANVLFAFNYTNGSNPLAGLTLATDGYYYGTTSGGGTFGYGVLFRISARGTYTVLHNFSGADGAGPLAAPIEGADGSFYGTTSGNAGIFLATIYKYTPSGTFSTLYQFDAAHGKNVQASLVQSSNGNLYGVAEEGGATDNGTIFDISLSGSLRKYYSFPGSKGGAFPFGLALASDGNFYGTTYYGGKSGGYGTIFKMDQKGAVSILYSFGGSSDGANPQAGLLQATDGSLYGTTANGGTNGYGTIFKIDLRGRYMQLYSFSAAVGETPVAALMQHTNGLLYGSAEFGGTYGYGAIYSLDMGLGPFVTFVLPTGKVGKTAEILGQGFTGTTSVMFNGVPATSFAVKSDTYMTALVPTGATTGPVVVITPTGTLTSNVNFRISK